MINGFPQAFAQRFKFADELQRDSADEGRVITAEFDRFYVVTVYTPNAKDDLSRLQLRSSTGTRRSSPTAGSSSSKKPVIFCGDLNVAHTELDLANPKPNRGKKGFTDEERKGFQNMHRCRLRRYVPPVHAGQRPLLVVEPFRQRAGAQRRMENRLCARLGQAARRGEAGAEIHADVMGSDHCPVSIRSMFSLMRPAGVANRWRRCCSISTGRLLDTAADIAEALNRALAERGWPPLLRTRCGG